MASQEAPITLSVLMEVLGSMEARLNMRFDSMETRLGAVETRLGAVETRLGAVETHLGAVETRLGAVETHLGAVETRLGSMEASVKLLEAAQANDTVRTINSLRAVSAVLAQLRYTHDGKPWPAAVPQPARFVDLAVSGAEMLPGAVGGGRSTWSRAKSRTFLACAAPPTGDESDGDDEGSMQSRTSRLRCVELMGGSFERVNGAVYAMP